MSKSKSDLTNSKPPPVLETVDLSKMLYNRRYVENSNAPTRHRTLRSGQRRPPSAWEFCKRRVLENFTSSAYKMHLPRQSLVGPALARLNAPFSHESRLFQGYIPASERRPPGGIVARAPLVVVSSVNSFRGFTSFIVG